LSLIVIEGVYAVSVNVTKANSIKLAQTDYPIHDLLRQRWSPRAFDSRPVEAEKLRSVLEAARWSASGGNLQPWGFLVATQAEPENFNQMVSCLSEGNVPWASQAPVLMITVAQLNRPSGHPNRTAFYDVGLAVQNLVVQATALGLYAHQMGGFSPDKAREFFAIPAGYDAVTMLALGYQGDPASLGERNREGEFAPRTRRPLTEFVFGAKWGEVAAVLKDA
jgi:nitroreductase